MKIKRHFLKFAPDERSGGGAGVAIPDKIRVGEREIPMADVLSAYNLQHLEFGAEYIMPKPLDPRLIDYVPPAVARAAVETGVARQNYPDFYPA